MNPDHHEYPGLRARLDRAIGAHDKRDAVSAAVNAVATGEIDVKELYEVLCELLVDVGSDWRDGRRSVWEEHLASDTVRTIVETLYASLPRPAGMLAEARTVVLACPPDEQHDLGIRMLSDRFEMAGWRTHLLGADTPLGDIAAAARTLDADLVVLSASTHFHRVRIRSLLDDLHAALPGVRVVVGGAAFTRDCCGLEDEEVIRPDEFFEAIAAPDRHDRTES